VAVEVVQIKEDQLELPLNQVALVMVLQVDLVVDQVGEKLEGQEFVVKETLVEMEIQTHNHMVVEVEEEPVVQVEMVLILKVEMVEQDLVLGQVTLY
tara:strand:- start:1276 stop:1566 length:291 start_codon:yes stop_codon:yes gene_type:complete